MLHFYIVYLNNDKIFIFLKIKLYKTKLEYNVDVLIIIDYCITKYAYIVEGDYKFRPKWTVKEDLW
jgi:hypothetical protein